MLNICVHPIFSNAHTMRMVASGFQMTFANGYVASVQWGNGNYCDNYYGNREPTEYNTYDSSDAEIAAFHSVTNVWVTKQFVGSDGEYGDDVLAHVKPDEIARFIAWVATLPAPE